MDICIGSCFSNFFVCFLKIMFWANLLHMYGNRMQNTLKDLGFFFFTSPKRQMHQFPSAEKLHALPSHFSPSSLMCMVLNCQALLKYVHFELAPTTAHNEGWMVSDKENSFLLGSSSLANHGG